MRILVFQKLRTWPVADREAAFGRVSPRKVDPWTRIEICRMLSMKIFERFVMHHGSKANYCAIVLTS